MGNDYRMQDRFAARLFLRGGNLVTFANSTTLPDPEVPFGGYPLPRTLTLGVDLSF